jgi:hypothetical protein
MTVNQTRIPLPSTASSRREPPPWLPLRAASDWLPGKVSASAEPREREPAQTLTGWPRVFPGL